MTDRLTDMQADGANQYVTSDRVELEREREIVRIILKDNITTTLYAIKLSLTVK
jgi:hypothetical protein